MPHLDPLHAWFQREGWTPFDFQREVWDAYAQGESGLVHSATGTGKTLAAWGGPLRQALADRAAPGLKAIWITPLRALSNDTGHALQAAAQAVGLDWRIEIRTGDTTAGQKAKQIKSVPDALITTPESLALLLSRADSPQLLTHLRAAIVDEWHELLSTKRGTQTELGLARLRRLNPELRVWGLSATLGNLDEAAQALVGVGQRPRLIRGEIAKQIVIDSLLPPDIQRFPWAGHLGVKLLPQVLATIEASASCLLFTNTRSHAEIWFQAILDARPEWKGLVELHHGSLDREVREAVEIGIKTGQLRCVVCTSSLDLGVDFTPVDRVLQLGSPKGVARLLQRAGRSGHQPGVPSRVTCVPTNSLELIDIAAARSAAEAGQIEPRVSLRAPLDVLAQHAITLAVGPGYDPDDLLAEVRTAWAYRDLDRASWDWVQAYVTQGGHSLAAYPEFRRVVVEDGLHRVTDAKIALRHRMSVGTIASDGSVNVAYLKGGRIGSVEESFAAKLKPGSKFVFGGAALEFVRMKDMTVYVKKAASRQGLVPRWGGGRMPLTTELAHSVRERIEEALDGVFASPEMEQVAPLLRLQGERSALPRQNQLLIERLTDREGWHLFFYPFEGRLVHEGLGALWAYRLSRMKPITFTIAANDYGIELLGSGPAPLEEALEGGLLSPEGLDDDIPQSLNAAELARRQFREVARVAGLIFQGYPGSQKTARQLQASSGLFFDVFSRYDPDNLLLHQAHREVLERQLEGSRLAACLDRLSRAEILLCEPERPTPFGFPLMVDRLRESVSSESLGETIEAMARRLEDEAS